MQARSWFEELFDEHYVHIHPPKRSNVEEEVGFFQRELLLQPGARVLDVGCGSGAHAISLAQRQLSVVGLDLSSAQLAAAKTAAESAEVEVDWICRDMRELDVDSEYDAVLNVGSTFGYFDDDRDNYQVLDRMAKAVKPGGRICVDVVSFLWVSRNCRPRTCIRGDDGSYAMVERQTDWVRGVQDSRRTVIRPFHGRQTYKQRLRLVTAQELLAWLDKAGLQQIAVYGGFDASPYNLDSRRLVIVAERPSEPH